MKSIPKSLTHIHVRNCISTIIKTKLKNQKIIRILDAGCGNGNLIEYMQNSLPEIFSNITIEIYGFDVTDHGVQAVGFINKTVSFLRERIPSINWENRIFSFSAIDAWKFEEDFFDFIVSNQVLEHVRDKETFFKNIYRCLKNEGYSFHLAPLQHCIHEGHIWIPFAHRIKSYDLLLAYIKFFSTIGIGKFKIHKKETGISLQEYAKRHADYMMFWTSYSNQSRTLDLARMAGFRGDFKFTKEFYFLKILQLLKIDYPDTYKFKQSAILNFISIKILRYLSSVTLCLQKGNTY